MAGSGTDKRQRQATLSARFNDEEARAVRTKAERAGLSVASLIRAAVLDLPLPDARAPKRPSADLQAVARLLGELGKIGSNLNQIAKHANAGRLTEGLLEVALRDLLELRLACLQALGREPVRDHPAGADPDQSPPADA
jgi:hypothetical protein